MNILKLTAVLSVLCFGAIACTTAHFAPARTDQSYSVRTAPKDIQLHRSTVPTQKYIEIGVASSCCSTTTDTVVELLRKTASEQGGDALLQLDVTAEGAATATVLRFQ